MSLRDDVLTYLNDNPVTGFDVDQDLPYVKDATPLYVRTAQTLFVDQPQSNQETVEQFLNGMSVARENFTVSVYVTTDAKVLPDNWDTLYSTVKGAQITPSISEVSQKETTVETDYDGDLVTTRFDLNFTKFVCN